MKDIEQMKHHAMKLKKEIDGVSHVGRTAYPMVKSMYGLRGGRQKVYDALMAMIDDIEQSATTEVS